MEEDLIRKAGTREITVIHHSADYDGVFCREIARKFLPNSTLIGWDFGQAKIQFPENGRVYVLDLSPDCLEVMSDDQLSRLIWIDHHKSSIEKWKSFEIQGYRIDGVAACRLTWQWFSNPTAFEDGLPNKDQFMGRKVPEPLAVTLAGEYDVWQHENSKGDDITFQFGLDSEIGLDWNALLTIGHTGYVARRNSVIKNATHQSLRTVVSMSISKAENSSR
jgi:oligoribonuclease NrnB/cAMP/cGMP phosphodiesterase (DHH superfamily)